MDLPSSDQPNPYSTPGSQFKPGGTSNGSRKLIVLAIFGLLTAAGIWLSREYLSIDFLAQRESALQSFYQSSPVLVIAIAFLIYTATTGLSIPGATVLSLLYAWFFGFWTSLLMISFASTAGASIAFLICRYLFRDLIESRFGDRLETFNSALDREGAFYLFTLRLVPAVPFFVINAVMGLTRIKTITFWWVSQIGMLAGTAVYCYAGSRIPNLRAISEQGIKAAFSASELTQIFVAFTILGVFPLAAKKLLGLFKTPATSAEV